MRETMPIPVSSARQDSVPPSPEATENWRDKPYLKLESELSRIRAVEDLIEEYGESGLLAEKMHQYYDGELEKSPHVGALLAEWDGLEGQIYVVHREIGELTRWIEKAEESSDTRAELELRLETSEEEITGLRQRVDAIKQDPDVVFLRRIQVGVDVLHYRAKELKACRENPAQYLVDEKSDLSGMPYEEVIFSDVNATYIVSPQTWDEYVKRSGRGIHYGGGIVSVAQRNPDSEQERMTVRHENKHALFATFFDFEQARIFGKQDARGMIDRVVGMIGKGLSENFIEGEFRRIQQLIWKSYLSGIKNEIMANYDGLAKGVFSSDFSTYVDIFSSLQWGSGGDARNDASVTKMLAGEDEQAREDYYRMHESVNKMLGEAREQLKEESHKFYIELADLFFFAEKEGLSEDLHSAMLLFDPLDYKKIKQYMTWKAGKEKYETYQGLRRVVRSPFFSQPEFSNKSKFTSLDDKLIDVVRRKQAFDKNPMVQMAILEVSGDAFSVENVDRISLTELAEMRLTDEEKQSFEKAIRDNILNRSDGIHPSLLEKDPVYVLQYLDKIEGMCRIVGISLDVELMRGTFWGEYVSNKAKLFIDRNNADALLSMVRSISVGEKKHLREVFWEIRDSLERHYFLKGTWGEVLKEIR